MQMVLKMKSIIEKAIGCQMVYEKKEYRFHRYCVTLPVADGMLLYNGLTKEMALLDSEEVSCFQEKGQYPDTLHKELIARWYLIPSDMDEKKLCSQIKSVAKLLEKTAKVSSYTVLTTTDCNARCFYCYEYGRKRSSMSEQTARDTAQYMIRTCSGQKAYLSWFGGEPLMNKKVIAIICEELEKAGIRYRSFITTNGYFFDKETVMEAKQKWKVDAVQITLDGTEEVYNTTKAYISKDISPFLTVIQNMEYLLQEKIKVNIRMNMDLHNAEELFALCDFLGERFKGYDNLSAYVALLFENEGSKPMVFDAETMETRYGKFAKLQEYIEKKGLGSKSVLRQGFRQYHCMADSDTSIVISPEGTLAKCQHFSGVEVRGDIYRGIYHKEAAEAWKEKCSPLPECDSCAVYPDCIRIKKCPDEKECNPNEQRIKIMRMHRAMLNTYEKFRTDSGSAGKLNCYKNSLIFC